MPTDKHTPSRLESKYEIVARLAFEHEYNSRAGLTGMELIPLPGAVKFLRDHRMLLKQDNSTYYILQEYMRSQGEWRPIVEVETPSTLLFGMRLNDPHFQNKTAIEFYPSMKRKFVIPSFSGEATSDEIELMDYVEGLLERQIEAESVTIEGPAGFNTTLPVEEGMMRFSGTDAIGVYEVRNGDDSYKFFWGMNDQLYDGIYTLQLTPGELAENKFMFKSRSLKWRFNLVQKFTEDFTDLELIEEDGNLTFEVEEGEGPGGEVVLSFLSQNEVQLRDHYDLSLTVEQRGKVLKKAVPFPSVRNLSITPKDVDNLCLEAYVTL